VKTQHRNKGLADPFKIAILWEMFISRYQYFGGTCSIPHPEDGGSRFLQNIFTILNSVISHETIILIVTQMYYLQCGFRLEVCFMHV
jgi:hypothetical protein